MKDLTIKGTGNSRFLKSVENFKAQYPTYDDFAAALVAGTLPVDFNGLNPDGVAQMATPLNKATLLTDETAHSLGLTSEDPTVNEALAELAKSRYRVGDTLETTRTDLGDSWALCNFEPFDPDSYPELAKVAPPWIASYLGYAPVVTILETDIILTNSTYPPVYTELDGVQIISGPSNSSYATDTKILWSTDNFKTYTQTRSAISNSSQRGSGVFKANGYYFHVGYEATTAETPYIYVSYSTDLITWTVGTKKILTRTGKNQFIFWMSLI